MILPSQHALSFSYLVLEELDLLSLDFISFFLFQILLLKEIIVIDEQLLVSPDPL